MYLLDNVEDVALDTLTKVSMIAWKMATVAQELRKDFEEEQFKVRKVANNTQNSQNKQACLVQTYGEEKQMLELKQVYQQRVLENAKWQKNFIMIMKWRKIQPFRSLEVLRVQLL